MALNEYKTMERTETGCSKHRAKIYTEVLYFALNTGRE